MGRFPARAPQNCRGHRVVIFDDRQETLFHVGWMLLTMVARCGFHRSGLRGSVSGVCPGGEACDWRSCVEKRRGTGPFRCLPPAPFVPSWHFEPSSPFRQGPGSSAQILESLFHEGLGRLFPRKPGGLFDHAPSPSAQVASFPHPLDAHICPLEPCDGVSSRIGSPALGVTLGGER
jgi:hypothetical protein